LKRYWGNVLEIEYKDGKEWLTAMHGPIGFGIACLSCEQAKPLFEEIDEFKKTKEINIAGTNYRLRFSKFESFGEWVYRIEMKGKNV
jgi:hypothetical protein